jgi:hypothetical protein
MGPSREVMSGGRFQPASLVAARRKSYLNKLNTLNAPLNRKPFLPQLGPLEHPGGATTKADIDNVRAEVRF